MSLPRFSVRTMQMMASATLLTVALSGCSALDSMTGDQGMKWVGDAALSDDVKTVDEYKAVASLPDLTAPEAATVFDKKVPKDATDAEADGTGWTLAVAQSEYATTLRYTDTCDTLTTDGDDAIKSGEAALEALGLDSNDWSWFSLTDNTGAARAIAEPSIEGRQTWATGSFAVLVNEDGTLCAANGILMRFEPTGKVTDLESAADVFEEARHTEGLSMDGDYQQYEQTWTLNSEGVLSPLWRFSAADHAIVAVQLGDGLETTFDTESSLKQVVEKSANEKSESPESDK